MKRHFANSQEPFIYKANSGLALICERGQNSYVAYLVSADGEPRHKLIAGERIDLDNAMLEIKLGDMKTSER